jgi:ribosomal protein S18 acetylase RimI-like enzyme
MAVRVRVAGIAEAALVHEITQAAFATHVGKLDPPSGALSETVTDAAAAIRRGGAAVAYDGATAVGSARWEITPDHLYVGRVAVLPAHRRRGVATALMRFIEAMAPGLGCQAVVVGVRGSLMDNVALYRSLGYEIVGTAKHPRGTDQVITMRKRLSPAP